MEYGEEMIFLEHYVSNDEDEKRDRVIYQTDNDITSRCSEISTAFKSITKIVLSSSCASFVSNLNVTASKVMNTLYLLYKSNIYCSWRTYKL